MWELNLVSVLTHRILAAYSDSSLFDVSAVKSPIKLGGILINKNNQFFVMIEIIVKTIIDTATTMMPSFIREGCNGAELDMFIDKISPMIPQLPKCTNSRMPKTIAVFNSIPNTINEKKT